MGRPPARDLTECELEVMHVFWSRGEATAAETRPAGGVGPGSDVCDDRQPRARAPGEGISGAGQRRASFRLSRGSVVRRCLRAVAGRPRPTGVSRLAVAIALPPGRSVQAVGRGAGDSRTDSGGAVPMNELGIALAWLAVQVTIVVVPALALHASASRRGPASGAWVAVVSLGLIALLCVVGLIAGPGRAVTEPGIAIASAAPAAAEALTPLPPPDLAAPIARAFSSAWVGSSRSCGWPGTGSRAGLRSRRSAFGLGGASLQSSPWQVWASAWSGCSPVLGPFGPVDVAGGSLRSQAHRTARRVAPRDGMLANRRAARGPRANDTRNGGLATAFGTAAGRLAVLERRRAPCGFRP